MLDLRGALQHEHREILHVDLRSGRTPVELAGLATKSCARGRRRRLRLRTVCSLAGNVAAVGGGRAHALVGALLELELLLEVLLQAGSSARNGLSAAAVAAARGCGREPWQAADGAAAAAAAAADLQQVPDLLVVDLKITRADQVVRLI